MPRNGSGTYTLPQPPFVPNTTIASAAMNSDLADIAAALTQSVSADGQTPITGKIQFPAGTAAAPSITFAADNTTGIYYPGTNEIGIAVGGSLVFLINLNNAGPGTTLNAFLNGFGASITPPVGSVQAFAGGTIPAGWFLCFGQAISRTNYPELYTVIATTYGVGDGSTTFNLPDLRGRQVVGLDNMGGTPANRIPTANTLGATGGQETQTITQANLPVVNLSSASLGINDPGHSHNLTTGFQTNQPSVTVGYPTGQSANASGVAQCGTTSLNVVSNTTGISITGNVPLGGSATGLLTLDPSIALNYMIYAGRP